MLLIFGLYLYFSRVGRNDQKARRGKNRNHCVILNRREERKKEWLAETKSSADSIDRKKTTGNNLFVILIRWLLPFSLSLGRNNESHKCMCGGQPTWSHLLILLRFRAETARAGPSLSLERIPRCTENVGNIALLARYWYYSALGSAAAAAAAKKFSLSLARILEQWERLIERFSFHGERTRKKRIEAPLESYSAFTRAVHARDIKISPRK